MRKSFFVLAGALLATVMVGCDMNKGSDTTSQARENEQKALDAAGNVEITHGTEARNVSEHIERKDDPATIQFIYVTLPGVGILYRGPVVGGVTSSNKALKPDYELMFDHRTGVGEKPLPHTSGTYGEEDSYVYWQDPAGNYYQTKLPYFMTDAPISISDPKLSVSKIDVEMQKKAREAEEALRQGKDVTNDLEVKDEEDGGGAE